MDDGTAGASAHPTHDSGGRRSMRVVSTRVLRGRHLHGRMPMINIRLDLGELEFWPTNRLDGFTDRLLEKLPGLHSHACCHGEDGGLVMRLREGTWLGHVIEHVAIELQTMAGSSVSRGKTRSVSGRAGVYDIMYAYQEEEAGVAAGRLAIELVASLLPTEFRAVENLDCICRGAELISRSGEMDVKLIAAHLNRTLARVALGPTTASIVEEAKKRGIPAIRLDNESLVQLGYGRCQKRIRGSITSHTPSIAVDCASDKHLTKRLLRQAGVPVPHGYVVVNSEEALEVARDLQFPLVVKPLDGNQGCGVSLNLRTVEQVQWAYERARRHSEKVLIEEQFTGSDYRILVVAGAVVAVAERIPAHVKGDSLNSIADLIRLENENCLRGEGHEKCMTRIKIDDHLIRTLENTGHTLESVPEKGHMVFLRETANLSTGGIAVDRTDDIHPDNATLALRAARALGLDIAGIDFVTDDISASAHDRGGGIVEVNASPGFRMHLRPSAGCSQNVAGPVIDMLFPRARDDGRIPIFAITGTNGKSTTVRLLECILRHAGLNVGMTTTSGVYIGGVRVAAHDASGPESARTILSDSSVDVAVLETARGGILRSGLGFDQCDAAAVLNVSADHLGLDGIETLDDLAEVKSVVAESVKKGGHTILNADDEFTLRMGSDTEGIPIFFTVRPRADMAAVLETHIKNGGMALACHDADHILIYHHGLVENLIRCRDVPSTVEGTASFNIQNVLAAAALAIAHGIPRHVVIEGLRSFQSTFEQNPGRFNVVSGGDFRVVLDYAHNPAGLEALGQTVERMHCGRGRIIASIGIAGDRRDEDIRWMGRVAARFFDMIMFWEDQDGRGREKGEVTALLTEGALLHASDASIRQVLNEAEAARMCIEAASVGDLVVVTSAKAEDIWRKIPEWLAKPQRGVEAPTLHLSADPVSANAA